MDVRIEIEFALIRHLMLTFAIMLSIWQFEKLIIHSAERYMLAFSKLELLKKLSNSLIVTFLPSEI